MTGLRPPPSGDSPSRVVSRLLVLILLVLVAGTIVWAAVTNQRIADTEDLALSSMNLETIRDIEGTDINITQDGLRTTPFVLLHDVDVAGGVIFETVVSEMGEDATILRVDLPGFGFSERIVNEESRHTVAAMAQLVSSAVEIWYSEPVVFVGVGLGGEVASEIAVTSPDKVAGLVLIDVDYYRTDGWREFVEKLPFVGPAATFSLETAGSFAFDIWAPRCETGGWCPSASQVESRNLSERIIGSVDSIRAFRRTPASSLVPSKLGEIAAPTIFIWSDEGDVPRDSADRAVSAIPGAVLEVIPAWKAHLDQPRTVADLIWSLAPQQ